MAYYSFKGTGQSGQCQRCKKDVEDIVEFEITNGGTVKHLRLCRGCGKAFASVLRDKGAEYKPAGKAPDNPDEQKQEIPYEEQSTVSTAGVSIFSALMQKKVALIISLVAVILVVSIVVPVAVKNQKKRAETYGESNYQNEEIYDGGSDNEYEQETETETTVAGVDIDFQSHTVQIENSAGYKFEITLKMSPWILSDNEEVINSAWAEVGSGKTLPGFDDWKIYGDSPNHWDCNKIFYSVGQISVKNITPGWDFSESNQGEPDIYIRNASGENFLLGKAYYSDETVNFNVKADHSNAVIRICPLMKKNTWGPLTIILAVPDLISPKYPDGRWGQKLGEGGVLISAASYGVGERITIPLYKPAQ